jgi:6-pyruvoyltetrahydropterin/6-carboxytetrahydropterin synthase
MAIQSYKTISVTKRFTFESCHYLDNPNWDKKKNLEVFGKCSKHKEDGFEEMHGHSYKMEVTVKGKPDPGTGFIINFVELKKIIQRDIVEKLDHRNLNNVMPVEYHPVTVENMLKWIAVMTPMRYNLYAASDKRANVISIKIWETEDSFAEITL